MKCHLSWDEKYPVYYAEPVEPGWRDYTVIDMTDDEYARCSKALADWRWYQDFLAAKRKDALWLTAEKACEAGLIPKPVTDAQ